MQRSYLICGLTAIALIVMATTLPLAAMLNEAGDINWRDILGDTYIQRVVKFSLTQAALSTLLSLIFAIPVSLALSHKPYFHGRATIVSLFSLSLVIPTIAAIYGIVAVFGRSGWLSDMLSGLSIEPFDFYGLPGILIAHVFFNMPLATRVLLVSLDGIPAENWRLCQQMGMRPLSIFRYIEWPRLRGQIPALAMLIFTLCFTSFAIVMTLGGGPRSTTIEVAIYQALRFDFDIQLSVALACIQLVLCGCLMLTSTVFRQDKALGFQITASPETPGTISQNSLLKNQLWRGLHWDYLHWLIISVASIYVLLPMLALFLSAINGKTLSVLLDTTTIHATINTLIASLACAVLSVVISAALLFITRHVRIRMKLEHTGQWLQLTGNVILVLPPLVLGTGLFLLLRPFADVFSLALVLVIIINSLMSLPFVIRILDGPMMNAAGKQDQLIQSLGIRGWNRLRLLDWPQLRRPIALSLALSATLAAGDLSAIALFGSDRVQTLPLLLYQRMGSSRLEESAVTAGMLLLLCLILFHSIQWLAGRESRAAS